MQKRALCLRLRRRHDATKDVRCAPAEVGHGVQPVAAHEVALKMSTKTSCERESPAWTEDEGNGFKRGAVELKYEPVATSEQP